MVRMKSVIVFESTVDVAMCVLISVKIFSISIVSSQVMYKNNAQSRSQGAKRIVRKVAKQATRQPGAKHAACGGHPH